MKKNPSHASARGLSDDYIDVASLARLLWQARWLVLGIASLVFALGCAYAVLAPPVYQANMLIKVDVGDGGPKSLPANLSGLFELKTAATAELEMLRSRSVVTGAVEASRLYIEAGPLYLPWIGPFVAHRSRGLSQPGLFGHGGYTWGTESIDVERFDVPAALEKKTFVITLVGPDAYSLRLDGTVLASAKVGEELRASAPEGELFLRVGSLAGRAGAEFVVRRFARADAVETLQKALVIAENNKASGVISVSLQDRDPARAALVLNHIARQYLLQNINLRSEEAERSLTFVESQLPDLKQALETAEANYSSFRNARGTVDVGEEVKAVLQQSVQSQVRLVELRQRRDDLLTRYQEENPLVEAVNQQIRTVSSEIGSINGRMRKIPATEQDAARLTRDVKVNTELYASLLSTAQQLRLVKASRIGSARLIDSAVRPSTPVKPNKKLIAAAAAAGGLFLGFLVAFVRRSMFNAIENPHGLAEVIGLPLGAVVPHSAHQVRASGRALRRNQPLPLLADDATEDSAVESLRTLRTALDYSLTTAPNNVIAIVGPTSGVGKSFVAANLSALLASAGKRVVLVDADLRGGFLHHFFGLERLAGLSEIVHSRRSIADVTNNIYTNLDFISTGTIRARPADSLAHSALTHVISALSERYDCVVIDTAPVLAVADALIVAKHAGSIFCVARRGVSSIEHIQETKLRFEQSGHPVTSLIFNGARPSDIAYGTPYRRIPLGSPGPKTLIRG